MLSNEMKMPFEICMPYEMAYVVDLGLSSDAIISQIADALYRSLQIYTRRQLSDDQQLLKVIAGREVFEKGTIKSVDDFNLLFDESGNILDESAIPERNRERVRDRESQKITRQSILIDAIMFDFGCCFYYIMDPNIHAFQDANPDSLEEQAKINKLMNSLLVSGSNRNARSAVVVTEELEKIPYVNQIVQLLKDGHDELELQRKLYELDINTLKHFAQEAEAQEDGVSAVILRLKDIVITDIEDLYAYDFLSLDEGEPSYLDDADPVEWEIVDNLPSLLRDDIGLNEYIGNDNDLLNLNCYDYLHHLFIKISAVPQLQEKNYIQMLKNCLSNGSFNAGIAYKNLYEDFFFQLIADQSSLYAILEENGKLQNDFINAIFENPNRALKRTAKFIEINNVDSLMRNKKETAKLIRQRLSRPRQTKANTRTSKYQGSTMGRFAAMVGSYHPVYTSSLPSVRKYAYHDSELFPTEIRFGTQGIYEGRLGSTPGINPLFEIWLQNQSRKKDGITHIYFNNLGLDRDTYEGKREKALTLKLQELEWTHPNVAVITLPADKGLMDYHILEHPNPDSKTTVDNARTRIFEIATGSSKEKIRDFYISETTKKLLYNNAEHEREVINRLIDNSLKIMGFSGLSELTDAQFMAVYFHFIKYELTNFIIDSLKPISFNMSCKDAIDRGGVSSAYYNLIKSIVCGVPLTQSEFAEALHSAPLMVKNRMMNDHEAIIKNTLSHLAKTDSILLPEWVQEWTNKSSKLSKPRIVEAVEEKQADPVAVPDHHKIVGGDDHAKIDIKKQTVSEPVRPILTVRELETLIDGIGAESEYFDCAKTCCFAVLSEIKSGIGSRPPEETDNDCVALQAIATFLQNSDNEPDFKNSILLHAENLLLRDPQKDSSWNNLRLALMGLAGGVLMVVGALAIYSVVAALPGTFILTAALSLLGVGGIAVAGVGAGLAGCATLGFFKQCQSTPREKLQKAVTRICLN